MNIGEAKRWLSSHDEGTPFLLRISFNAPHTPVVPPAPYDHLYAPEDIVIAHETDDEYCYQPEWIRGQLKRFSDAAVLTKDEIARARAFYFGQVAYLDSLFGDLLDWMGNRGLLENTIVVLVSDHGTHLGDYGLFQKQTFYEPVVSVPFFFWYPGVFASGIQIETPVETRCMLPALLRLVGLPDDHFAAGDLLIDSLLQGREPFARPVFSEFTLGSFEIRPYDRLVMVRDGDWKLSLCLDPEISDGALVNLREDPYEHENRYHNPECRCTVERLTKLIVQHIGIQ